MICGGCGWCLDCLRIERNGPMGTKHNVTRPEYLEQVIKLLSHPHIQKQLIDSGNYIDFSDLVRIWDKHNEPEIDPTESTPVLSDEPEDLQHQVETLNARVLYLEAELEEHRRSVDGVLEALRGLGTTEDPQVGPGSPEYVPDAVEWPFVPVGMSASQYLKAQGNARNYLSVLDAGGR